jgi:ERF superfamily protein
VDDHSKAVAIIERPGDRSMSPVVATGLRILEQNPNPETLRELLAVQREWEANEARKAYAMALVALKRDLPTVVERDATVDFTNNSGKRTFYNHASLAGVMDAVTEPLTEHGFSLTWHPTTADGRVTVTCRLTHAGGHIEETTISAPIDDTGGKSKVQGVMSTITLLSRYTALSLLGIATRDMAEPTGEGETKQPDPAKVDTNRNLRAVGLLKKKGRTVEQAVALLEGRTVEQWTETDLKKLEAWAKAPTDGGQAE